jgi:WhiB family redox-sensing transcriptional regulator
VWQGSTPLARHPDTVWDVALEAAEAETLWLIANDESDPLEWLAQLTRRPPWHARAACRGAGTDAFIVHRSCNAAIMARARAICAVCPVTVECLDYALANMDTTGIWGGTTAQQRQAMRAARVP